ncbi:type II toxin-antitoxin system Phd/YefM family antitoxin [Edwardsiella tarda]|uniref:type II toxin-antitoxin system Phd/YefM family antitoxin n=1 Tax=Edwardsiella tarda TaxID=636 RepID=UPI0008FAD9E4|nr:type II toxin-antitoxin system Phd/YefM family antitoxin [Edwardsiella tarda]WKS82449.1 type II toxin-antitoxin system Phd/YefM family antitoxin [Edwardsiella tarda]
MFTCSYSHARDNLASLLERVIDENQPVEIQRRKGGAAVLIDKDAFERYRQAALDAEFAEIMQTHGTTYTELSKK